MRGVMWREEERKGQEEMGEVLIERIRRRLKC